MSTSSEPPPLPPIDLGEPGELFLAFLDFYREAALRKIDGLTDAEVRTSRVPSGWSPLGLVKHVAYMERRWLVWGFAGKPVDEPWGDAATDGTGWRLDDSDTREGLRCMLERQRARTQAIVSAANATDRARPGGRFDTTADCPTLAWVLCHVLEEYARHLGHLDIARELTDGTTGE